MPRHPVLSDYGNIYSADDASSLYEAMGSFGGSPGTVLVGSNMSIDVDTIVPVNVTLQVGANAVLSIASGITLNVLGDIKANPAQIFSYADSTAKAEFANSRRQDFVVPQWWGAVGDGETDDYDALTYCFNCGAGFIRVPQGTYGISGTVYLLTSDVVVQGQAGAEIKLLPSWSSPYASSIGIVSVGNGNVQTNRVKVRNLTFNANYPVLGTGAKFPFALTSIYTGITVMSLTEDIEVTDCRSIQCGISGFFHWGGGNGDSKRVTFTRCVSDDCGMFGGAERGGNIGHNYDTSFLDCKGVNVNLGIQVAGSRGLRVIGGSYYADDQYAVRFSPSDWGDVETSVLLDSVTFVLTETGRISPCAMFTGFSYNPVVPRFYGKHADTELVVNNCRFICKSSKVNTYVYYPINARFNNCTFQGGTHGILAYLSDDAIDMRLTPVSFTDCNIIATTAMGLHARGPVKVKGGTIASGINDGAAHWGGVYLDRASAGGSSFRDVTFGSDAVEREEMVRGIRSISYPYLYGWETQPQDIIVDNVQFKNIATPFSVRDKDIRGWKFANTTAAQPYWDNNGKRVWKIAGDPYDVWLDVGDIVYNGFNPGTAGQPTGWICTTSGLMHKTSTGDTTIGDQYIRNVTNTTTWETGQPINGTGLAASTTVTGVSAGDSLIGLSAVATASVTGTTLSEATITALNPPGTVYTEDDIEVTASGAGFILTSANGTRYRVKIANDGSLLTDAV